MTTLGLSVLTGTGDPGHVPPNALTTLAARLVEHRRAGTPFPAAWNDAVSRTRGLHAYTQSADPDAPSPVDFARVRWEAAYNGEDYSRPTCSTSGCVELSYRHGQCRLHCPVEEV